MSASSRPPTANCSIASKADSFREDLFYRLHVLPLTIPPLRMRREDIPHLLRHFLARFCAEENRTITGISGEAMAHAVATGVARQHPPARERGLSRGRHERHTTSSGWRISRKPPRMRKLCRTRTPQAEPLIVDAGLHSTAPAMVSGNEIPIAPLPSTGTADVADQRRRSTAARRARDRDHPVRDLALSRTDVGGRTPA